MPRKYLSKEDILKFLRIINEKLKKGLKGEIALFGDSVMCNAKGDLRIALLVESPPRNSRLEIFLYRRIVLSGFSL